MSGLTRRAALALGAALPLTAVAMAPPLLPVERWGFYEIALEGPKSGNPFVDVSLSATFTRGAQSVTVPGFMMAMVSTEFVSVRKRKARGNGLSQAMPRL